MPSMRQSYTVTVPEEPPAAAFPFLKQEMRRKGSMSGSVLVSTFVGLLINQAKERHGSSRTQISLLLAVFVQRTEMSVFVTGGKAPFESLAEHRMLNSHGEQTLPEVRQSQTRPPCEASSQSLSKNLTLVFTSVGKSLGCRSPRISCVLFLQDEALGRRRCDRSSCAARRHAGPGAPPAPLQCKHQPISL
ncbi:hypothetical protein INR49_003196 [Caranx melampygus]|nr:hypothetical protein INR49_003196 [Caranx melampygus]